MTEAHKLTANEAGSKEDSAQEEDDLEFRLDELDEDDSSEDKNSPIKGENAEKEDSPVLTKSIAGMSPEEVLEGEDSLINLYAKCELRSTKYKGRLIVTTYQVVFIPADLHLCKKKGISAEYFKIPHGLIANIQKSEDGNIPSQAVLELSAKDGRRLRFFLPAEDKDDSANKIFTVIDTFAFPDEDKHVFAFAHKMTNMEIDGWTIFIDLNEYERMGIDYQSKESPFRLFLHNIEGTVCPTYPQYIIVPQDMSDQDIQECANSRDDERFPALTYYHRKNGASIWRSSQPRNSTLNKSDQKMLKSIIATVPSSTKSPIKFKDNKRTEAQLHIFDLRIKGSTSPKCDFLSNWVWIYEVETIQKTREAYQKLLQISSDHATFTGKKWFAQLDSTGWLQNIAYILSEVNMIVDSIRAGKSVLTSGEHGRDRSSQLVALVQLILDKYYRTIEGFEVLIEKDFLMFGHEFKSRSAQRAKDALTKKEFSPIFIQFLDCVYQMTVQYPSIFEFNSKFLLEIAHHVFSLRFGTFLQNCDNERRTLNTRGKTVSLWSYMSNRKEYYKNMFYVENDPEFSEDKFYPDPLLPRINLWEELYMAWTPTISLKSRPMEEREYAVKFKVKKAMAEKEELEKELRECKQVLEKYKEIIREADLSQHASNQQPNLSPPASGESTPRGKSNIQQ